MATVHAEGSSAHADRLVRRGKGPSRLACAGAIVAALLGTAGAVAMVREASSVFAASWSTASLREGLNDWSTEQQEWTPEQWDDAERTLKQAVELTPQDAVLFEQLGLLYAIRGRKEWTGGEPGSPEVGWYLKSAAAQQQAIDLRPLHPMAWANLAMSQSASGQPLETVFATWRRANQLGPLEPEVQETLALLVMRHWYEAPPDLIAWMELREPGVRERVAQALADHLQQEKDAVQAAAAEAAASAAAATRRAALEAARTKARLSGY